MCQLMIVLLGTRRCRVLLHLYDPEGMTMGIFWQRFRREPCVDLPEPLRAISRSVSEDFIAFRERDGESSPDPE